MHFFAFRDLSLCFMFFIGIVGIEDETTNTLAFKSNSEPLTPHMRREFEKETRNHKCCERKRGDQEQVKQITSDTKRGKQTNLQNEKTVTDCYHHV